MWRSVWSGIDGLAAGGLQVFRRAGDGGEAFSTSSWTGDAFSTVVELAMHFATHLRFAVRRAGGGGGVGRRGFSWTVSRLGRKQRFSEGINHY